MFERFTPRARQVIVLAGEEARRLRHNYIGTEHLLLGLLREEEGIAARELEAHDVELEAVRAWVARIVGQGDEVREGQLPLTPRMLVIVELANRQAMELGHHYVGTEHLLLALISEGAGAALHALRDLGAPPEAIWSSLHRTLGADEAPPLPAPGMPDRGPVIHSRVRSDIDEGRGAWLFEWRTSMVAGAAIFVAGLVAGWLIWG